MIQALWLLLGCGDPEPRSAGDCGRIEDLTAREDCRLGFASALLPDLEAVEGMIQQIPEPESRDLLRLRMAVRDPVGAGALCARAETAPIQERCKQVLGRPHLRTPAQGEKNR